VPQQIFFNISKESDHNQGLRRRNPLFFFGVGPLGVGVWFGGGVGFWVGFLFVIAFLGVSFLSSFGGGVWWVWVFFFFLFGGLGGGGGGGGVGFLGCWVVGCGCVFFGCCLGVFFLWGGGFCFFFFLKPTVDPT